jgi:hypothetical protein
MGQFEKGFHDLILRMSSTCGDPITLVLVKVHGQSILGLACNQVFSFCSYFRHGLGFGTANPRNPLVRHYFFIVS